jgi:hypothetical protein
MHDQLEVGSRDLSGVIRIIGFDQYPGPGINPQRLSNIYSDKAYNEVKMQVFLWISRNPVRGRPGFCFVACKFRSFGRGINLLSLA